MAAIINMDFLSEDSLKFWQLRCQDGDEKKIDRGKNSNEHAPFYEGGGSEKKGGDAIIQD